MQPLLQALEQVRGRARWMLLSMRAMKWLIAVMAFLLLAGVGDYLLRLPAALRLAIVMLAAGTAIYYAAVAIVRMMRLQPGLEALALRLERLQPATAGRFASAVAFARTGADHDDSPVTRDLAQRAEREAVASVRPEQIRSLIDPAPLMRVLAITLVVVGATTGVAIAAGPHTATALQRWFNPLGGAEWPRRYEIRSATDATVLPNDKPLRVTAEVTRGDAEGLRTWVVYRFTREGETQPGEWRRALMTRQSDDASRHIYQRTVEPVSNASKVELRFEAGDDATDVQNIELIQPPTLTGLTAEWSPPAYAKAFEAPQREYLLEPPRPSVTHQLLEGSRLTLEATVEGSLQYVRSGDDRAAVLQWLGVTYVGLLRDADAAAIDAMDLTYNAAPADDAKAVRITLKLTLRRDTQFSLQFADAYGKREGYEDPRIFRFEVRPDRQPSAVILDPTGDENVLATAVVNVVGEARDDVAVERMALLARSKGRDEITLATDTMAKPKADVDARFDLQPLALNVGDEIALVAVAKDNFLLDERSHPVVESTPRVLRIISEEQFMGTLRGDIAELRERTVRAEGTQSRVMETESERAASQQQQELSDRIQTLQRAVAKLQGQMQRNRLNNDRLSTMLQQANDRLGEAQRSSSKASEALDRAADIPEQDPDEPKTEQQQKLQQQREQEQAKGREAQQSTAAALKDVSNILDQGRDTAELTEKLTKLGKEQDAASGKTRATLPKTLGRAPEQLSPEQREELGQMEAEQARMAKEAKEIARRMRETASALDRQSDRPEDKATSEALRRAAEIAEQQQLDQKMQQASENLGQNKLGQANQQQQQASQAIKQMLEQIGQAEELKRRILERRLLELVQAIEKLIEQQTAQRDRVAKADVLDGLDVPLLQLRTNTLAVAEKARATDPKTIPVAEHLDAAAEHQRAAVKELRGAAPSAKTVELAETQALDELNKALEIAKQLAQEAQNQENEDKRGKLVKKYQEVLEQQKAVRGETDTAVKIGEADRDRRWRRESVEIGKRQDALRQTMRELQSELESTVAYAAVHEEIDAWAEKAARSLEQASPDTATVFQQDMIIMSITSLIDALKQDQENPEFAEDEGGGGGGGGGAGGPQPLIPPQAEVKLLKLRQQTIRNMTGAADNLPADAKAQRSTIVDDLSSQQGNLAETGKKLIQALQQMGGQ